MLKAWRAKLVPEARLARSPQTFIVGTEKARSTFNTSYSGLLRRTDFALSCDIATVRLLCKQPDWRWIAVVESAAELRSITAHIESPGPSTLVVAIVCADERERCALRAAALNELGGVGVVVATEPGEKSGRAAQVVQRVLQAWNHAAMESACIDEAAIRRLWGEPSFAAAGDVIIPPLWDSEGKIRAVVDAAGLDFDEIVRESSWHQGTGDSENIDIPVLSPEEDKEQLERARERKKKDMEDHDAWIKSIEAKLLARTQGQRNATSAIDTASRPGPTVSAVTSAAVKTDAPSNSDFFQKLLSSGKR